MYPVNTDGTNWKNGLLDIGLNTVLLVKIWESVCTLFFFVSLTIQHVGARSLYMELEGLGSLIIEQANQTRLIF